MEVVGQEGELAHGQDPLGDAAHAVEQTRGEAQLHQMMRAGDEGEAIYIRLIPLNQLGV